ncbi:MAG: PEP/pyruvate-binding domain-containing protein [Planctomycetes bacterium]|nr:PEP/pyruvate-binding domain-containing protein [Planctomycetota bacterium]
MKPSPLIDAHDEARFGGKAGKLARSLQAGLPVPPGFALGCTHVEAIHGKHPDALNFLRQAFIELAGPCAVRSSAIGEDSQSASFAGQHLTLLNVRGPDHVAPAVLQVRESARTDAALAYRRKMGMDETPQVAVVVQRMIEPDCAGVMFTRDPIRGANERVIEAAWGLGEAVVAGLVVPDNFVLGPSGDVRRIKIGCKDIALRSNPAGGTIEEAVAADLAEKPCLLDAQLAQLSDLAARCEKHFGAGLDLEWAFSGGKLYLLQCRAMTR